jgi:hypothetical protein
VLWPCCGCNSEAGARHVQVYFASAMEAGAYVTAMAVLDPLPSTPDTHAQWSHLGGAALAAVRGAPREEGLALLEVATRAAAATGDVARASFLRCATAAYEQGLAGSELAFVRAEVRVAMRASLLALHVSPAVACRW